MKRFILLMIMIFGLSTSADALVFRGFTSLTGTVSGSIDNTDCADIGNGAEDAGGIVTLQSGEVYFYYFDQSATNATSSPTYIRCKNYATSGVWIKLSLPDNDIDSDHYTDGSIDEAHLNIANAPTDEYVLTYEDDTSNFQWVELAGGGDITTVGDCVTGDCTDDFVDGTDIADDAIDSEHYTDGSIDKGHLAADVIDETKLEDNSIDSEHYNDGSIDPAHLNIENAEADGYILSYALGTTNFEWVAAGAGDITNVGTCTDGECADDFIDGTDIADEAIDSEHYSDGSIDEIHLDISNEPTDEYVLTYEADTTNFQWVAAGTGDITNVGECASGECTADFINGTDIVDASISDEHLDAVAGPTDEYVLTWEDDTSQFEWVELAGGGDILTVGECTTGDCTDDFINGTDLVDNAVDSEHYTALSIDKGHLAADVIDETKLEDNSLDSEHYNDASIDPQHLNIEDAEVNLSLLSYASGTTNFDWIAATAYGHAILALADEAALIALFSTPWTVPLGGTGAATLNDGGLLVGAGIGTVEVLADGLATEILVGGGADTNPAWGTDIPTAVTLGTKYIYRAEGTDVPVADGGTNSSTVLNNDFVMVSSGGAIVESATVTATELALLNGETDLATQAELNAVAALVDTDDEIIAIINASPGTQITVPGGGSGAGTFTDGGILLGSGTGAFTALATGTDGQIPIGSTAQADPIMANITEETDALTITNGAGTIVLAAHANLEAIADAEAGVASPGITMYDDNGTGTGTAFIYGTTVDDNKDVVMSIGVEEQGSETPAVYIELDGINERVDVLKPLNAGIDIAIKSASYNIETTESDVCRKVYYRYGGSGQDTFTLPALTQCNSISGYGKEFYFLNYDSGEGEDIWIEPAGTDKIWLNGISCTASLGVQCTTDQGDRLHIFGSSETNWTVQDYTGTCACETP